MTLADKLRQEGMQKGMQKEAQKERTKLIKNILSSGMSIEQIASATKLTSCEIENSLLMNV